MDCGISFDSKQRDSAWYGNLASVRTDSLKIDLIESGANGSAAASTPHLGQGGADEPSPAHEWAAVEASIKSELFPLLGDMGVQPTDPID